MKQLWYLLRTSFFQARLSIPFSCLDKLILLIDCFCYGVYCDGDFKEFFQSFVIKLYSFTIKLVMDSLRRYKDPETLDTALILSTPCTVALWSVNLGQTTREELWFQLQFLPLILPETQCDNISITVRVDRPPMILLESVTRVSKDEDDTMRTS